MKRKNFKLPPGIKKSDGIGLIAPAGIVSEFNLNRALNLLRPFGFEKIYFFSEQNPDRYFSANDHIRAENFNRLLREEIRLIWCLRGGYGSNRIINRIGIKSLISKNIIFCGYSDITLIHSAIFNQEGLVTFQGPMPGIDFSVKTSKKIADVIRFFEKLGTKDLQYKIKSSNKFPAKKISGISFAGCLSILQTTIGTSFQPELRGSILFLEDVKEEPYKIERMLIHCIQAGLFNGVKLIFFSSKDPGVKSRELRETLDDFSEICKIPVITGFNFGHQNPFNIIPIGTECIVKKEKDKILIKFKLKEENVNVE